jgi:DNA invertase Pin-like site-specific DNA recombinase
VTLAAWCRLGSRRSAHLVVPARITPGIAFQLGLLMSTPIVAYYRVSTQKQGRSRLGLEAQRKAVATYAASQGLTVVEEFTEIETGKGADALERRPVFAETLRRAKKLKAPIVVAKLDRLSRDVAFIATLMAKKVDFVTADDPTKSPFMLHIKAAVAEEGAAPDFPAHA